jgi:hypothetical protein
MKAKLGGHYLAALKEAGVKIMVGECLSVKEKTSCYDPSTNTIIILGTHDTHKAVDTLAEEAKHAFDYNKKREESILVSLFGHGKQTPQELFNDEIAGHLARIVVYQDLLAAGAETDSKKWSETYFTSNEEIEALEKGELGDKNYALYSQDSDYRFSGSEVTIWEPWTDGCVKGGTNESE